MHRTLCPSLFLGLAIWFSGASASFGFTSTNFDYVQLSSPLVISWNGQSGEIALRLMVYPSSQELDYLPVAANISGSSYTWLPTSLSPGSQWTLEGIDEDGNIAASPNFFTIQGALAPGSASTTSFMQQNPQSTAQPTTSGTAAATTTQGTNAPGVTITNSPSPSNDSISTGVKVGVAIGVGMGVAGIVSLATFFILRYRQKRGKSLSLNPFRSKKQPRSPLPFELQDNDSMETLSKPMELQGSRIEGISETGWGDRMELGLAESSRQTVAVQRISIASGAVETSMGKRMELG